MVGKKRVTRDMVNSLVLLLKVVVLVVQIEKERLLLVFFHAPFLVDHTPKPDANDFLNYLQQRSRERGCAAPSSSRHGL